jgi:tRNA-2-methylthio-N6-dimethylallyladenosine synthase
VAVSSDFIVGFPGESEASFQRSVELLERARFKNSFIFKYSPRAGTKADLLFIDDVPEDVKRRRNNDLLAVQTAISLDDNRLFVGRCVEVLVEGPSKAAAKQGEGGGSGDSNSSGSGQVVQLTGRTSCDRIVVFPGPERLAGHLTQVAIDDASAVTLFGQVVTGHRVEAAAAAAAPAATASGRA